MSSNYMLTEQMVNAFAAVSGDYNPIHMDPEAAAKTKFGGVIAHGALLVALNSGEIARSFPGVVIGSLNIHFFHPVFPGRVVSIIHSLIDEGRPAWLTSNFYQGDRMVATMTTELFFPKRKP